MEKTSESAKAKSPQEAVPAEVDAALRLYPQYPEAYVTAEGFVRPAPVPAHLVEEAVLYKNKYYKQPTE